MNSETESLMSQYLDGRVSPEEAAELAGILAEDPEAAARFAELTRVDEGLRTALKAESRSQVFASRLRSQAETAAVKKPVPDRRRWLAAAAGLAVLGGTAWWLSGDSAVPGVVMDWAKSRVKRSGGGGGNDASGGGLTADLQASLPVDRAAELRRKLRGFAIPYLHLRSLALTDAVNTLNRQWTDLPHRDPEDARRVKIDLSESARKRWPSRDREPLVSVDMPNLSLHTALTLIAAQSGLQMEVTADAVTLAPYEGGGREGDQDEKKTWSFPLTQPVADTFLASVAPPSPGPTGSELFFSSTNGGNKSASPVWSKVPGQPDQLTHDQLTELFGRPMEDGGIVAAYSVGTVNVDPAQNLTVEYLNTENGGSQGAERPGLAEATVAGIAGVMGATAKEDAQTQSTVTFQVAQEDGARLSGTADPGPAQVQEAAALPALAAAEEGVVEMGTVPVERFSVHVDALYAVADGAAPSPSADVSGTLMGRDQEPVTTRYLTQHPTTIHWSFKSPAVTAAPSLESWLTGLGGGAMTRDTENGTVSVTGSPVELRTASAAIAALSESAQAGVSVETRLVRLGGNAAPDFLSGMDGNGTAVQVPAGMVDRFLKSAAEKGISVVRLPSAQGRRNQKFPIALDGAFRPPAGKPLALAGVPLMAKEPVELGKPVAATTVIGVPASGPVMNITADKRGERWTVHSQVPDAAGSAHLGAGFMVTEGSWVAVPGVEPGGFLLMRFRSVAVPP